jgi:hypothetical protein
MNNIVSHNGRLRYTCLSMRKVYGIGICSVEEIGFNGDRCDLWIGGKSRHCRCGVGSSLGPWAKDTQGEVALDRDSKLSTGSRTHAENPAMQGEHERFGRTVNC